MPDIMNEITSTLDRIQGHVDERIDLMQARIDELQAKAARPNVGGFNNTQATYADSVIRQLSDPNIREGLQKHSSVRFEIPSITFQKTLVSGGLPYDVTAPLPAGRYPYRLRGEIAVRPTEAGSVIALRETFNNNAAPQAAQGDAKAVSNFALTPATLPVSTVAHYCKISRQSMDDLEGLGMYLSASLVWGLEAAIEDQILNGTGANGQLAGLYAGASNSTTNYSAISRIDAYAYCADELANAGFFPSHIIVSPTDWLKTVTKKDNSARYIIDGVQSADGVPTLWGLRVIVSPKLAANVAMVADLGKVVIRSRQRATVQATESNSDDFTKNLLTIRAEERLALVSAAPASALKFTLPA
jgi:hypothetical protein